MKHTRVLSVTSGKGGVGKSTIAANIALQAAQNGNRVLLFDGDVGMANLDILFGCRSDKNIIDVIQGNSTLNKIKMSVAENVDLIPGGSGIFEFNKMGSFEKRALLDVISYIQHEYDLMIIDTAPGIADHVLYFNASSDLSNVVITPDPASITDSYALIKVLNQVHKIDRFGIICNQVRDQEEALMLFKKFNDVVQRFLFVGLDYMGSINHDQILRKTNIQQRLIMRHHQDSNVADSFREIAAKVVGSTYKLGRSRGLQFLFDGLMNAS